MSDPGQGDSAFVGMCEVQVLDDSAPRYDRLDPRQFHGSAYGMVAARRGHLRAVGQWNSQEVRVEGSHITVELNGAVILDSDLSQVTSFTSNTPHPGKNRTSGFFGLAGHGDPVEYRKIEVRELNGAGGIGGSPTGAVDSPAFTPPEKPQASPTAEAVEPGKPIPPGPFRVATNGLAGRQFIDPMTFGADWLGFNEPGIAVPWATKDAFARLTTKAALAYPRLPVSRYVCEVELTVHKRGQTMFFLGDPSNASALNLLWNPKREMTECSVSLRRHDGGWFWGGSRDFAPEQRISLKLVVGDGVQTLFHENNPISWAQCWPTDCCLRIWSETPDSAVIHRCSLRPLTAQDVAACGWPTPPTNLALNAGNAAARLAKISENYPDRPKQRKNFTVRTTGTPMAWIPPGEFVMGNRKAGDPVYDGRHRVRLTKEYWMAQIEVTQGEFSKVTGANPSRVRGSPYLPVDWVAWNQTAAYCRKLTNLEQKARRLPPGYEYRLPTEAEWEYASRAGSDEDFSVPVERVWSRETSGCRPHEVAESQPNQWGLYDMHGNAMEWCFDAWYGYPTGEKEVAVDPFKIGQPDKDRFVVRGGAWWSAPHRCASHVREWNHNYPNSFRGFRIVLGTAINSLEQ
jgi:formylglycine-generating enzyme required for sulfatase activity